jgi:transposase
MRPSGSPGELERRRKRAIALLGEGYAPVEVAQRVGADRRSVRRWKAAYRSHRRSGIAAQPIPGRPAKLDEVAKAELQRTLLKGARAAGFDTELWTCPRVSEWIEQRYGVSYHVDHLGRLLHSLGFSPQKPQRRAIERDEQGIEHWVKHTWARV